ncbi:MAG: ScyD/ScyE family protein [Acidobacteriota bacterium]
MTSKRVAYVAGILVVGGLSAVAAAALLTETVAGGLSNPRGIALGPGGRLLVAQIDSGVLTEIRGRAGSTSVSTIAQFQGQHGDDRVGGPVDVAAHGLGNTFVLISGGASAPAAQLVRVRPNGQTTLVADIGAYQQTDPDPFDTENFPEQSNPNGLAIVDGDNFLVTDAANNDLLHITKQGAIETVARFPLRSIPFPFGPNAGRPVHAEAVPTAVAVGPDGAWYVSELVGFPFTPGTARIWRIEPGTTDWTCDETATGGPCTVYATGFTSIIDLAFGPDGTMYVLELAKNSVLNLASSPLGALYAVKDGVTTELVPGTLLAPGGVVVDGTTLYVTTRTVFGPGAGSVVRIELN